MHLRPTIAQVVFGFNVTHEDEAKRAVFSDLKFRTAMSHAINRPELNENTSISVWARRSSISASRRSRNSWMTSG